MDNRMRLAFLLAVVLTTAACSHLRTAAGPVIPDRPGFGDAPTALPAGGVELETGFTNDRARGTAYQTTGESLMRVGIGAGIELRVFGNSYASRSVAGAPTVRGMEDSKVGAKIGVIDLPDSVHGIVPGLAFLFATSLPNGANGIGAGVAQPEGQVAASWNTGTPFSIGANAGVSAAFDGTAWSNPAWTSASVTYGLTSRISFFVEAMHQFDARGPAPPATYADGGVTVTLGDKLELDARIGRGTAAATGADRFFGFGIARRF
jgi:hypothetical protein